MPQNKFFAIMIVIFTMTLACTSVSQFVGMPDPNDPGINPKDEEDDSIGAAIERQAGFNATYTAEALTVATQDSSQSNHSLELTPEEELNSGQHFYRIEGKGTPLLGGDGTYSGEGYATSSFVNGGVNFNLSEQAPALLTKTGPNTYTNENATIVVKFTSTGFELHTDNHEGVAYDYSYELND